MVTLRHRLLLGLTLASTALLVAAACGPSLFDGLTGGDAGHGPTTGEACDRALAPAAPTSEDTTEIPEIYFAFDEIKVDTLAAVDGGIAPARGYDLDGLCTACSPDAGNLPTPPSCVVARSAATTGGPTAQCDQSNGRDNNLGAMFNTIIGFVPGAKSDFATEKIRAGLFTILVDVKGWNGKNDDPSVSVTIYGSLGLEPTSSVPAFDGTDTWSLDPASLVEGDSKIGLDCRLDASSCTPVGDRVAQAGNAYVSGGTLVAKFAAAPLNIDTNVGSLLFDLDAPQLVAKIGKDDTGRYRLQGELVGRWPVDKALHAIGSLVFPDVTGKIAPLCTSSIYYGPVKIVVCSEPDLPTQVDGGSGEPCGAISSAIAFKASDEARPSFVYQRDAGSGLCATDTCAP